MSVLVQPVSECPAYPAKEPPPDEEEDDETEEEEESDDDAGSLVDFIVDDSSGEEEGPEEEAPPEYGGASTVDEAEASRRELEDIDPANIVTGKRKRRQTVFLDRQIFGSAEYQKMVLQDVPPEEVDAALGKGEEDSERDDEEASGEEEAEESWAENDTESSEEEGP